MNKQAQIVAEVSKSYQEGENHDSPDTISHRFEHVIETNRKRGYELESWQFRQTAYVYDGIITILETIVAVFQVI